MITIICYCTQFFYCYNYSLFQCIIIINITIKQLHCTVIRALIVLLLGTSLEWKYESKNGDTTL